MKREKTEFNLSSKSCLNFMENIKLFLEVIYLVISGLERKREKMLPHC